MKLTSVLFAFGMFMCGVAVGIGVGARMQESLTPPPAEVHEWDITDPWERCLSAMEAAEIPGDMWECHEPGTGQEVK